ncbi:HNH homing endonuclease [Insectomime virus]|nr:HNH homing endonuclease [Insectomime virus]
MCDCGEEEIWKPIEGHDYEVSSCGRVRDEAKKDVPAVFIKERGCHVRLPGKHVRLARLVAFSFIPNPKKLKYVKRKDGNEKNNHLSNLFWSENPSDKRATYKVTPDFLPVEQYTLEDVFVKIWDGPKEAAEKHGGVTSQVRRCCEGKQKTFAGFKWKWGNDPDLEGEIWKECKVGVKKISKVSNMGRLLLESGAKTYGRKDGRGYLLYAGVRVHRLVADAFCEGELTDDSVVNHKNSKKTDNRAENLEICSSSWNTRHSFMKPGETPASSEILDVIGEEWEELPNLCGYKVSNKGRILGPEKRHLLCRKSKQGLTVSIKGKTYRMKHLVADAFIPNPEKKKNVHCINGNEEDVSVSNLERCNRGEETGLKHRAKKKKDTIVKFSLDGEELAEYTTFSEAVENADGILKTPLSKIVSADNRKEYGGFIWRYRSVVDFPGEKWETVTYKCKEYTVSSHGRILSERGRKTFGGPNNCGYMVYKNELVHRIVATAFLAPPLPSQNIVNHIDGIKTNNHKDNLEWTTPSANSRHAHETGLISLTSREEFRNKEI